MKVLKDQTNLRQREMDCAIARYPAPTFHVPRNSNGRPHAEPVRAAFEFFGIPAGGNNFIASSNVLTI